MMMGVAMGICSSGECIIYCLILLEIEDYSTV